MMISQFEGFEFTTALPFSSAAYSHSPSYTCARTELGSAWKICRGNAPESWQPSKPLKLKVKRLLSLLRRASMDSHSALAAWCWASASASFWSNSLCKLSSPLAVLLLKYSSQLCLLLLNLPAGGLLLLLECGLKLLGRAVQESGMGRSRLLPQCSALGIILQAAPEKYFNRLQQCVPSRQGPLGEMYTCRMLYAALRR